MNLIDIPIRTRDNPKKYSNTLNLGNENPIKTPVVIDKIMAIHIILNEF
jgi:hypothetical protein